MIGVAAVLQSGYYASGSNSKGQLGSGSFGIIKGFTRIDFNVSKYSIDQLVCSTESCAFISNKKLYVSGRLLNVIGEEVIYPKPNATSVSKVTQVDLGNIFAVFQSENGVFTAGKNNFGNLGRQSLDPAPAQIEMTVNRLPNQIGATNYGTYLVYDREIYLSTNVSDHSLNVSCVQQNKYWCKLSLPYAIKRIFNVKFFQNNIVIVDENMLYYGMGQNQFTQLCSSNFIESGYVLINNRPLLGFSMHQGTFSIFYDGLDIYYCGETKFSEPKQGKIQLPKQIEHIIDILQMKTGAVILVSIEQNQQVFGIGQSDDFELGWHGTYNEFSYISTVTGMFSFAKTILATIVIPKCSLIMPFFIDGHCTNQCVGIVFYDNGFPICDLAQKCNVFSTVKLQQVEWRVCICTANFFMTSVGICVECTQEQGTIDSFGKNCIQQCDSYVYLENGKRICTLNNICSINDSIIVSNNPPQATCGTCNAFLYDNICLQESCSSYYYRVNGCKMNYSILGYCNHPITDALTCRKREEPCSLNKFQCEDQCTQCLADNEYILGLKCVNSCSQYIFSNTGLKICDQCTHLQNTSIIQADGHSVICGDCNYSTLLGFCIERCIEYTRQTSCQNVKNSKNGGCDCPLELNGACVSMIHGCVGQLFQMDFVCVKCDQRQQFVDHNGTMCISKCANYVFSINFLKICLDDYKCDQYVAPQQQANGVSLSCGPCSGAILNTICLGQSTCLSYSTSAGCIIDTSQPNCFKPAQYQNKCYKVCPSGQPNKLGICVNPTAAIVGGVSAGAVVVVVLLLLLARWLWRRYQMGKTELRQETAIDMMRKYNTLSRKREGKDENAELIDDDHAQVV